MNLKPGKQLRRIGSHQHRMKEFGEPGFMLSCIASGFGGLGFQNVGVLGSWDLGFVRRARALGCWGVGFLGLKVRA